MAASPVRPPGPPARSARPVRPARQGWGPPGPPAARVGPAVVVRVDQELHPDAGRRARVEAQLAGRHVPLRLLDLAPRRSEPQMGRLDRADRSTASKCP